MQFELRDDYDFTSDAEVLFAFRVINPFDFDYSYLELISTTDFRLKFYLVSPCDKLVQITEFEIRYTGDASNEENMFYFDNYIEPSLFFNPEENMVPLDQWDLP